MIMNSRNIRVLVLDDEPGIRMELNEFLTGKELSVLEASTPAEAFDLLSHREVDIAILDLRLPEMSGLDVLRKIRQRHPMVSNIIISGHGDMDTVIDALRLGAVDFFRKPFRMQDMFATIENTCRQMSLSRSAGKDHDAFLIQTSFEKDISPSLIAITPPMKQVVDRMRRVARTSDTTVLITGESGTGKDLVARGIHHLSNRRDMPFHAVNCSSIPDELFESEFFGYNRGAFTGASVNKPGWFELADKGTLFLDEISDLKLSLQSKLLRILEDRKIVRLGATRASAIDVRIVAATNRNLRELVAQGHFREDLFHRLNIFTIHVPPLRERREAIPLLLEHFLVYYSEKLGMKVPRVSRDLMEALLEYDFPGNIRELKHMVERAIILCEGNMLTFHHFDQLEMKLCRAGGQPDGTSSSRPLHLLEKESIVQALLQSQYNKSHAARLLGITRQALDRRIEKYGILLP